MPEKEKSESTFPQMMDAALDAGCNALKSMAAHLIDKAAERVKQAYHQVAPKLVEGVKDAVSHETKAEQKDVPLRRTGESTQNERKTSWLKNH